MHHITKSVPFISKNMTLKILECQGIFLFFEDRKVYQQTHGQRVMNYAGAIRAPIQNASVCTQTDVSWVGVSLLQGSNVQLLLSIAGQFRPFHDQWELPLEWRT